MPKRRTPAESDKIKIGTILDKTVVEKLKQRSVKEGKNINTIIEEAVMQFEQSNPLERDLRRKAFDALLGIRFNFTTEDWNTVLEEGYYGL